MSKPLYIRAKREKTIVFLCIEPRDSLDQVKTKLCQALDNKRTSEEIRLLVDGKSKGEYTVLESAKPLENSSIVYFVYLQENGQWETVDITEPELLDDEEMMEEEELPVAKKEKGKGRA